MSLTPAAVVVTLGDSDDEAAAPPAAAAQSAPPRQAPGAHARPSSAGQRAPIEVPLDDSTEDEEDAGGGAGGGGFGGGGEVGMVDITPGRLPYIESGGGGAGDAGGASGSGGGRARSHSAGGGGGDGEERTAAMSMMGRPAEDHGTPVGTLRQLRQRTTSFSDERIRFSRRAPAPSSGGGGGALVILDDDAGAGDGGGGAAGAAGAGGAGAVPAGATTPDGGGVGVSVVPGSQADRALRSDVKVKAHVLRKPAALKRLQRGREAVEKRAREKMAGKVIDREHALYQLSFGMMLGIFCSVVHGARRLGKLSLDDFMAVEKLVFPPKGSKMTPAHSMPNAFKFKASGCAHAAAAARGARGGGGGGGGGVG
jgi:hypothetical protein